MAKLTPDATRTEHGLVINEKIIPWGAVWPKDSGAYKKGAQYKADRLLSGGTGKVKGVTIHNTNDLKNVEEDAEQYTRATWPNANMNDARVHYYVDDINEYEGISGPGSSSNTCARSKPPTSSGTSGCPPTRPRWRSELRCPARSKAVMFSPSAHQKKHPPVEVYFPQNGYARRYHSLQEEA